MKEATSDYFSVAALREAFERTGKTQRVIAAELGVTPTTMSSLLKGKSIPSMKRLHKIVDVLGGELTDYLELPPRHHWEIKHYRLAAGLTQAELATDLDVAAAAVSGWELGKHPPNPALYPPMAELFGVTAEQLKAAVKRQFPAASRTASRTTSRAARTPWASTLALAEALTETVLGFAKSATETMTVERGIPVEARDQLNGEIRARIEEALGMLTTLIPQLPEEPRARTIRLVGRLSTAHDATFLA